MEVLDSTPIELDAEELMQTLKIRKSREEDIAPLIEECRLLIEPKSVYAFLM